MEIALEFLQQRLGKRSTRSMMYGDTTNVWEDIELIIYPDHFYTSLHLFSVNKKDRSKNPLNPKAPLKWVLCI